MVLTAANSSGTLSISGGGLTGYINQDAIHRLGRIRFGNYRFCTK